MFSIQSPYNTKYGHIRHTNDIPGLHKTLDTIDVCLHTTDIYSIQVSILVLDSTDIFLYTNDFTFNIILMTFCCFPFKINQNKKLLHVF